MADITYCINSACPFKDCDRHPSKISKAALHGKGYVSVANFDGVCRRYIGYIVEMRVARKLKKRLRGAETVKNGKRPTREQKMLMTKWHLNYNNWLVVKDTSTEMVIVHRDTGRTRIIQKGERE